MSLQKRWEVLEWSWHLARPVRVHSRHYWAWSAHLWSRLRPEPLRARNIVYVVERMSPNVW